MSSKLKTLAQYVQDSIEGYQHSQERASDPALSAAFTSSIRDRQQTLGKINQGLVSMGEDQVTKGSMLGSLHDMWSAVTTSLTNDDDAVVNRIEEGETYLIKQFEDALRDDDLTPTEREIVGDSLDDIRRGGMFSDRMKTGVV